MLPVVAMPSKPTKAKKHVAAPRRIPSKPNGVKPPEPRGPRLWGGRQEEEAGRRAQPSAWGGPLRTVRPPRRPAPPDLCVSLDPSVANL